MTMRIELADRVEEREALYAFRYRIYVEEMQRVQKYADCERRRIEDPLDPAGYNLVAWDGQAIVGCLRVNGANSGGMNYCRDLLRMATLAPGYPTGVSLCTRLMVAPSYRNGPLALRLCTAAYEFGLAKGFQWNFIDCNDHLVAFFRRLGYVWTHRALHDEYGMVNAMRLELHDTAHLEVCRSPFLRTRPARKTDVCKAAFASQSTGEMLSPDG